MSEGININVKLAPEDYKALETLVKKGKFLNISDAVRTAVRKFIEQHKTNYSDSGYFPERKRKVGGVKE